MISYNSLKDTIENNISKSGKIFDFKNVIDSIRADVPYVLPKN